MGAIYLIFIYNENRELQKKADEMMVYLKGTLEMPLWNFSNDDVKQIALTVTRNEMVEVLEVLDEAGRSVYSFEIVTGSDRVTRYEEIFFEGNRVGEVRFAMSNHANEKHRKQFLMMVLFITALILISLVFVTSSLTHRLLQRPLEGLNRVVESYSRGIYHMEDLDIHYSEFRPFERVLVRMGDTITEQIDRLLTAEEELRKSNAELENRVRERTAELESQAQMLYKAKKAAESATQAKSDFLARMSHEIRTPMNAVIGLTNLAMKTDLDKIQQDYLYKIDEASRLLLRIINDILDFSKIEAGKLEIEKNAFFLHHVVDKMANMFRVKAAEKQIELFYIIDQRVSLALVGDALRLGQILINLISNAVKFTHNGDVIIRVEVEAGRVGTGDGNDLMSVPLIFSVKDTGDGIPREKIESLFEPFTQVDGSVTRRYGGTGLGLSICQRLIHLMGGRIWAESRVGEGSTFFFSLVFDRQEGIPQYTLVPPPDIKGVKALVVDDNETARLILEQILTGFDMEVTTAASAEEGIRALVSAAAKAPFRLVVVDWKMPGTDGLEMVRTIHDHPQLEEDLPKIIMVTMYDQDRMDRNSRALIDSFLLKPVSSSDLFNAIMEVFDKTTAMVPRRSQSDAAAGMEGLDRIRQARILLVEDNLINQQVALASLAGEGMVVDVADNGQAAVRMLESVPGGEVPYDAVLMDVEMPVMDGHAATRAIRRHPRFSDLPVIAMTAHALEGDRERCIASGMNDYISKPFEEQDLFGVLIKWIKPKVLDENETAQKVETFVELPWTDMPDTIHGINLNTGLDKVKGNSGLYKTLLGQFYDRFKDAGGKIRESMASGDVDQAKQLVHSVKGVAGNIGANELFLAAGNLNQMLAHSMARGDDPGPGINRFCASLDSLINALGDLETTETVAGVSPSDSAIDTDLARTCIPELESLLVGRNSRARKSLPALRAALDEVRFGLLIRELETSVYRIDFKSALGSLEEIKEKLSGIEQKGETDV